jgi:hypothetical protein
VASSLAEDMRQRAAEFLSSLDADGDRLARHGFDDREARRWLEYRPRPRPGVCVADLGKAGRKAAHRLLATGLPPAAYAQAIAVMSLEEVLDRREGWARGRHGDDYWVSVFGDPGGPAPWGWRFEGHHLSVSMTLVGDDVSGAPIFLGANPHRVSRAGRTVLSPLAEEEALGLALLDAMSTTARKAAVVSPTAPDDIRSGPSGSASPLEPAGVGSRSLGPVGRAALDSLVALYLDRLPPPLAVQERDRIGDAELFFAWEGRQRSGGRHYYRVQAPDLLIEYDNTTEDGNHAHTVLRRPAGELGADLLAAHRADLPH